MQQKDFHSLSNSYKEVLKESLSINEAKLYASVLNNEVITFLQKEGYEKIGETTFMNQIYEDYRKADTNPRIIELKKKIKKANRL